MSQALLALLALLAGAAGPLREVRVEGVTAYERDALLARLGVVEGRPLRRDARGLERSLAIRYELDGYPAARADVTIEGDRLAIRVEEGRLAELRVNGTGPGQADRARALLALEPGRVLRAVELAEALVRLERGSGGSLRAASERPWTFEPVPEGVRAVVDVQARPARLALALAGPGPTRGYTRVGGLSPPLWARLDLGPAGRPSPWSLYGSAAWAFSADHAYHAFGLERRLGALALGYEFHDLFDSSEAWAHAGFEGSDAPRIGFSHREELYRRRGHDGYLALDLDDRLQLTAGWRAEEHRSLPRLADDTLFGDSRTGNPPIDEGDLRSVLLGARFALHGPLFAERDERERREARLLRRPEASAFRPAQVLRLESALELGRGDFDFERLTGSARAQLEGRRGLLRGRLLLGRGTGTLPAQRRFRLGGLGSLPGYDDGEQAGSRMWLAGLEAGLRPRGPWPWLLAFVDAGRAWEPGDGSPARADVGLAVAVLLRGLDVARLNAAFPLRDGRRDRTVRITGSLRLGLP